MLKKIVEFLVNLFKMLFNKQSQPETVLPEPVEPQPELEQKPAEPEVSETTNEDYINHFKEHLIVNDTGVNYVTVPPSDEPWIKTTVSFAYDGPYKIKRIGVELAYYKFEENQFGLQAILLQDLSTYKVGLEAVANGVDDVLDFIGFDDMEAQMAAVDVLFIELDNGFVVNFKI